MDYHVKAPSKRQNLRFSAGYAENKPWHLRIRIGNDVPVDTLIGPRTTQNGWKVINIDLAPYQDQEMVHLNIRAGNEGEPAVQYWHGFHNN